MDTLHEPRFDPPYTTDQPRMAHTAKIRHGIKTQFIGPGFNIARDKGLVFWQTLSNAIILIDSMPADCLVKVVKRDHDILYQKTQLQSKVTSEVVPRGIWRHDRLCLQRPEAFRLCSNPLRLGRPDETFLALVFPSQHSISGSAPGGIRPRRNSEKIDLWYCAFDSVRL